MVMGVQVELDFQSPQKIQEGITKFIIGNGFTMQELSGMLSMMSWTYTLANVRG